MFTGIIFFKLYFSRQADSTITLLKLGSIFRSDLIVKEYRLVCLGLLDVNDSHSSYLFEISIFQKLSADYCDFQLSLERLKFYRNVLKQTVMT